MTEIEFFETLKAVTKDEEFVMSGNSIRSTSGWCPILAVANKKNVQSKFYQNCNYFLLSNEMGLKREFADLIVNAADAWDGAEYVKDQKLRKKLLKICKLKERT